MSRSKVNKCNLEGNDFEFMPKAEYSLNHEPFDQFDIAEDSKPHQSRNTKPYNSLIGTNIEVGNTNGFGIGFYDDKLEESAEKNNMDEQERIPNGDNSYL